MIGSINTANKPVTVLFNGNLVGGQFISIPELSTYKKLEVHFGAYNSGTHNTGGNGNVCYVSLEHGFSSTDGKTYAIAGMVVPYFDGHIDNTNIYSNLFGIRIEVNLTDNKFGVTFSNGTSIINGSTFYSIFKIIGYK